MRWAFTCWPIGLILSFWESKVHKNVPWTLTNHLAKCDAASFIFGGEIRNRTNTHTHIHTNKQ